MVGVAVCPSSESEYPCASTTFLWGTPMSEPRWDGIRIARLLSKTSANDDAIKTRGWSTQSSPSRCRALLRGAITMRDPWEIPGSSALLAWSADARAHPLRRPASVRSAAPALIAPHPATPAFRSATTSAYWWAAWYAAPTHAQKSHSSSASHALRAPQHLDDVQCVRESRL